MLAWIPSGRSIRAATKIKSGIQAALREVVCIGGTGSILPRSGLKAEKGIGRAARGL